MHYTSFPSDCTCSFKCDSRFANGTGVSAGSNTNEELHSYIS